MRNLTEALICVAEESMMMPAVSRRPRGSSAEHTQQSKIHNNENPETD